MVLELPYVLVLKVVLFFHIGHKLTLNLGVPQKPLPSKVDQGLDISCIEY